jgi:hypothetical protein
VDTAIDKKRAMTRTRSSIRRIQGKMDTLLHLQGLLKEHVRGSRSLFGNRLDQRILRRKLFHEMDADKNGAGLPKRHQAHHIVQLYHAASMI